MFSQCPLDLGEKIVDQSLRVGKAIGTAWIVYRPVPMIMSLGTPSGTLPGSRHAMSVVEAYQPSARWLVQGEGIGQTVGPSLVRFDSLDPELEPISLFEVVNAPVKGEKKLELMFRTRIFHILTGYSSSGALSNER